jgi:hypothetical protein
MGDDWLEWEDADWEVGATDMRACPACGAAVGADQLQDHESWHRRLWMVLRF